MARDIIETLRTYGGFAVYQLESRVAGSNSVLKKDYFGEVLDELDRATPTPELVENDLSWLKVLRSVLEAQTGRSYDKFDRTFIEDYKIAVSNLRSVQTFPSETLDPRSLESSNKFLVNIINEALKQDFSYKRMAA